VNKPKYIETDARAEDAKAVEEAKEKARKWDELQAKGEEEYYGDRIRTVVHRVRVADYVDRLSREYDLPMHIFKDVTDEASATRAAFDWMRADKRNRDIDTAIEEGQFDAPIGEGIGLNSYREPTEEEATKAEIKKAWAKGDRRTAERLMQQLGRNAEAGHGRRKGRPKPRV